MTDFDDSVRFSKMFRFNWTGFAISFLDLNRFLYQFPDENFCYPRYCNNNIL